MCGKHVVATRFIAALVLCLGLASCGTTLHDPVAVSGTSGGGNDTAALDAGFADTAHLTRVFRRGFGLTPSAAIAGLGSL